MIEKRATVFEENPHVFIEKHRILMNEKLPVGYRAVWSKKSDLAVAKLGSKIESKTDPNSFPSILLEEIKETGVVDFIEVYIYGEITNNAIESFEADVPRVRADRVLLEALREQLSDVREVA